MNARTLTRLTLAAVMAVFVIGCAVAAAQRSESPEILYQRGIDKEVADADFTAAIDLYRRVVDAPGVSRTLAAQALLRMGQCYERQSNRAEAGRVYERIVQDYSAELTVATEARVRLNGLSKAATASKNSVRRVFSYTNPVWTAFTPDGRYLLDGSVVRDLNGSPEPLTGAGRATTVTVPSPDGKRVAIGRQYQFSIGPLSVLPNGTPASSLRFRAGPSSDVPGTPRIPGLTNESVRPFGWNAEGSEVFALATDSARMSRIVAIAAATGELRSIKDIGWRWPNKLSVSPDGRYVAYDAPVARDSANRDIYVIAADGAGEPQAIVQNPGLDAMPAWTPDGKAVAFVSERSGKAGLWMVSVSNGKASGPDRPLRPDVGAIWPLGFTRDGALLYYTGPRLFVDVTTAEIGADGTVSAMRSVAPGGNNSRPSYSPDGSKLAYFAIQNYVGSVGAIDGGGGLVAIVLRDVATGKERRIPTPFSSFNAGEGRDEGPAWAPDGKSLVFLAGADVVQLHRIDVNTGEDLIKRPVVPRPSSTPRVSPDGKRIYYSAGGPNSPADRGIWMYDADTQKETMVVATSSLVSFCLSPDGKTIYYAGDSGIMAYDLATRREVALWQGRNQNQALAVSPDGKELVFSPFNGAASRGRAEGSAVFVSTTSGAVRQLSVLPGSILQIQWTPDEKSLLIERRINQSSERSLAYELLRVRIEDGKTESLGRSTGPQIIAVQPHGNQIAVERAVDSGNDAWQLWIDSGILADSGK